MTKSNKPLGFSLIELMAAVTVLGIVSAVTIPKIIQVRYRNSLTETVNSVQEGANLARKLALQTRHAAVLEVRSDKVWVNLLDGAFCESDVDRRCHRGFNGANEDGVMFLALDLASKAGVAMCGGGSRVLTTGNGASTCDELVLDVVGFGICYTGTGELYVRATQDANMECDSGTPSQAAPTWQKACGSKTASAVAFEDGTDFPLFDGAIVVFNRYEDGICAGEAEGVRRGLFLPSGGAPFNRVAGAEVAP